MSTGLWLIIPAKRLDAAKSRLAGVLSAAERHDLSLRLTCRTLDIAAHACRTGLVARFCLVSADPLLLDEARARDGIALSEIPQPTDPLNHALSQAAIYADEHGAQAILILPTDLPHLEIDDISAIIEIAELPRRVAVVAPDSHDDGTNALLVSPPLALPFSFGAHSFARHIVTAHAHALPVVIARRPGLALDLDTPADL